MMEILEENRKKFFKMLFILMVILALYFAAKTISEIKNYNNIPSEAAISNTITFDGTGEITAAPDLATVSFTIVGDAKDIKSAQAKVTVKENAVLDFLDKSGIAKSDIKTENYSSYPKYEYQNAICPPIPLGAGYSGITSSPTSPYYCPPGKQVLTGYEVSENISVKIHNLIKTGDIVKGIGDAGISNISGPNFSIENEDALKEKARKMAIDDAKAKAETLAKDLGVHLVRIVNFSENGNYPIMYAKGMMALDSAGSAPSPSPVLPTGENKITSNVTITYEIR